MTKSGEASLVKSYDADLPKLDDASLVMLPVADTSCMIEQVFSGDSDTESLAVETAIEVRSMDRVRSEQIGVYKFSECDDKSLYVGVSINESLKASSKWMHARFDYSARSRSVNGDLAFWLERGRWVYGCFKDGHCIYADVLSEGELEGQLKGLLPRVVMKLAMLGIEYKVARTVVEDAGGRVDLDFCSERLGCEVVSVEKAHLVHLSVEGLDFCPVQVENFRSRKSRRVRGVLGILLLLALLFTVAWFAVGERRALLSSITDNERIIELYRPTVEANSEHLVKMSEIELLVSEHWALNQYSEVVKSIPDGDRLIRIEILNFSPGSLDVRGRASSFDAAVKFGSSLRKNVHFEDYVWSDVTPREALDKSHWKFHYKADIKKQGDE